MPEAPRDMTSLSRSFSTHAYTLLVRVGLGTRLFSRGHSLLSGVRMDRGAFSILKRAMKSSQRGDGESLSKKIEKPPTRSEISDREAHAYVAVGVSRTVGARAQQGSYGC